MDFLIHSAVPTLAASRLKILKDWQILLFIFLGGLFPDAVSAYEKIFVSWSSWDLRAWAHDWRNFPQFSIFVIGICLAISVIRSFVDSKTGGSRMMMIYIFAVPGFFASYFLHVWIDGLIHRPIVGGWYWWAYVINYGIYFSALLGAAIYFWHKKYKKDES